MEAILTNKTFVDSVKTIAVIPACNEERTIGSVVIKACAQVETVIVLDLGSVDATSAIAAAAGAVVVEAAAQDGGTAPLAVALLKAREYDPDAVITLEGEWKYLLDDVSALVSRVLHDEADLVVGQHVFARGRIAYQHGRSVCRVYSPQALDVFSLIPVAFERSAEIKRLATDYGLNVVDAPVEIHRLNAAGQGLLTAFWSMLTLLIGYVKQDRLLLTFSMLGAIALCVGLPLGLVMVVGQLLFGEFMAHLALVVFLVLGFGIVSTFIGLFLHGMHVVAERALWPMCIRS
jgi:hypothetical protein